MKPYKLLFSLVILSSPFSFASNLSSGNYTSDGVKICLAQVQQSANTLIVTWETINKDIYPNYSCQFEGKTVTYQYDRYADVYRLSTNKNLYIQVQDSSNFIYGRKEFGARKTEHKFSETTLY